MAPDANSPTRDWQRSAATRFPIFIRVALASEAVTCNRAIIIAAVDNMLEGGRKQRQFYLGIDFIQKDTPLPKMQIWQEKILADYPHVADLALPSAGDLNLFPEDSLELRIHSVGGWGAITMGKNLAMTCGRIARHAYQGKPEIRF